MVRLDLLQRTSDGLIFAWARLPSPQQIEAECDTCLGLLHNERRNPECGTRPAEVTTSRIVLRENHEVALAGDVDLEVLATYTPRPGSAVYAVVYGPRGMRLHCSPEQLLTAKCFAEYCTAAAKKS